MISREEARQHWPNAVWFFGDPCPVGKAVVKRPGTGLEETGIIVGEMAADEVERGYHWDLCPTCTCERPHPFRGFWKVAIDNWRAVRPSDRAGAATHVKDAASKASDPDAMVILCIPMELVPREETVS